MWWLVGTSSFIDRVGYLTRLALVRGIFALRAPLHIHEPPPVYHHYCCNLQHNGFENVSINIHHVYQYAGCSSLIHTDVSYTSSFQFFL